MKRDVDMGVSFESVVEIVDEVARVLSCLCGAQFNYFL